MALVVLLTLGAWLMVYPRNKIFKDDFALYGETLRLNPKAHSLRRNFAVELMDAGLLEEAKSELDKIIELASGGWWEMDKVYNQLGNYYRIKGDFDLASEYYQKSIDVSRGLSSGAFNNLGAIYLEKEEYLKSLLYLCRAMQLDPTAKETNNNFNRIADLLDSVQTKEGLRKLYSDILLGGIFIEGSGERFAYSGKTICEEEHCNVEFMWVGRNKIFLPFLALAVDPDGEIIKIKNRVFDPKTGAITVDIDDKYQDKDLTFIFPACDGRYYQVSTAKPKSIDVQLP